MRGNASAQLYFLGVLPEHGDCRQNIVAGDWKLHKQTLGMTLRFLGARD